MKNVEVIVGTYEEFLLGYRLDADAVGGGKLTQSFADKSHSGALKCVAVQGRWVATGATDDRIFVYDMRSRKQSQIILSHEGTVNAIAFTPDETHVLSGGDDGRMIATRLDTWFTEATWKKAHGGCAVTHIRCHPSGKLALSLGADMILRTWNLVKGRVAYKTNLKSRTVGSATDCLAWSPSGEHFTLSGQRVVEIWSITTADVVRSRPTQAKPICVCWLADEVCLVGLEDGKLLWVTLADEEGDTVTEAHSARVKALAFRDGVLVTASSAGEVKMWQVDVSAKKLKQVAATNIGCRPTCLEILDLEQFGAEYTTSSTIAVKQAPAIKPQKKQTHPERGVVTINYDDEESEEEAHADEEDDGENNADSMPEEEDIPAEDTEDSEDTISEDDAADAEPLIRLPKSRKRKQQILNSQKLAAKAEKPKTKGTKNQHPPKAQSSNSSGKKQNSSKRKKT